MAAMLLLALVSVLSVEHALAGEYDHRVGLRHSPNFLETECLDRSGVNCVNVRDILCVATIRGANPFVSNIRREYRAQRVWQKTLKSSSPFLSIYAQYKEGESVRLWVNKVGPYNNPQETYNYYELPFCKPQGASKRPDHKWGGLGEVLQGNELIDSQLDFRFRGDSME